MTIQACTAQHQTPYNPITREPCGCSDNTVHTGPTGSNFELPSNYRFWTPHQSSPRRISPGTHLLAPTSTFHMDPPPPSKRLPGFADPKKPKPILKKGESAWKQRSDSAAETRAKVRDWILPKAPSKATTNAKVQSEILTAAAIADAAVKGCAKDETLMKKPAGRTAASTVANSGVTTAPNLSNNNDTPSKAQASARMDPPASKANYQGSPEENPRTLLETTGYPNFHQNGRREEEIPAISVLEIPPIESPIRSRKSAGSPLVRRQRSRKSALEEAVATPTRRRRMPDEPPEQPPAKKQTKSRPKKQREKTLKQQTPDKNLCVFEGTPDEIREGIDWTGWTKRSFKRKSGNTKGRLDHYWFTPQNNYKLRSIKEVERFFAAMKACGDEKKAYEKCKP